MLQIRRFSRRLGPTQRPQSDLPHAAPLPATVARCVGQGGSHMDAKGLNRRQFIKVTTATAAAAATGIEGIIAARRAPAYAQGTKLHMVRWVDFIPESDVELKRQMPEASKALGAEVVLETINANDLQPRITAAIQSGSGADIFIILWNWAQLYGSSLVDVSDLATALARSEGGFYDVWRSEEHTSEL